MRIIDIINSTKKFREQQYKVKKVSVVDTKYIQRTKQLYIYGEALPLTGDKLYKLIIVFDGITSSDIPDKTHKLIYRPEHNPPIYLSKPNMHTNVRVRCSCPDYYFSFEYYNKQKKALIGPHKDYVRKTTWYPPRNPQHLPGMCKHTLVMLNKLIKSGLVEGSSNAVEYLNRPMKEVF